MFDKFRYWLSSELIGWGIAIIPDEFTKTWMKIGVSTAIEGIENDLTSDD